MSPPQEIKMLGQNSNDGNVGNVCCKNWAADGTLTSRTRAKWYHQEQLPPHPASCDTQPGTGHNRSQQGTTGNDQLIPLVGQSMPDTWGPQRVLKGRNRRTCRVLAALGMHRQSTFCSWTRAQTRWHSAAL